MHILIVTDQHVDSLGGVQVAIRLQRKFLERAGHRVSIAAPTLHRPGYVAAVGDRGNYINLPSRAITKDREYGISWPGSRTDRALSAALSKLPPIDVIHIQGDFWGALIGIRAARGLNVPVVLTMHNNVDEGTRAVTRLAPLVFGILRGGEFLRWGAAVPVSTGRPMGLGATLPSSQQRQLWSPYPLTTSRANCSGTGSLRVRL
ncbi:glycosyltransferase [Leucobacter coleopterorum]|uniref:glycosyltransferase n=1 Tax=Leucobacter coleopterorum TaxID=2714933 RepID=UPI001FCB4F7B|nr:glycosyltransferase [Leucobacter coleopterorum]